MLVTAIALIGAGGGYVPTGIGYSSVHPCLLLSPMPNLRHTSRPSLLEGLIGAWALVYVFVDGLMSPSRSLLLLEWDIYLVLLGIAVAARQISGVPVRHILGWGVLFVLVATGFRELGAYSRLYVEDRFPELASLLNLRKLELVMFALGVSPVFLCAGIGIFRRLLKSSKQDG